MPLKEITRPPIAFNDYYYYIIAFDLLWRSDKNLLNLWFFSDFNTRKRLQTINKDRKWIFLYLFT